MEMTPVREWGGGRVERLQRSCFYSWRQGLAIPHQEMSAEWSCLHCWASFTGSRQEKNLIYYNISSPGPLRGVLLLMSNPFGMTESFPHDAA